MKLKHLLIPALVLACTIVPTAVAKNDKPIMPSYVLTAHTVAVVIDSSASISLDDPYANDVAAKDVETALTKWGRFDPVSTTQQPDLIIVIRKGHKQLAEETVHDPRAYNRPGSVNPSQNGGTASGQRPPQASQPTEDDPLGAPAGSRTPQLEVAGQEDYFVVYQGNVEHPTHAPFAWRWIRKDGLHPHDVPAVEEFRKALIEADKQAAKQAAKPSAQHP